jgi:cysteine desulfurase family protein
MPYLDNAATSWPKPESVYQAVDRFMRESAANPGRSGHRMAVASSKAVEEARVLLAALFNSPDHKRIVFTLNCTDGLNMALKGLLKPGDHVIADTMSHNSLVRPLNRLARQGVKVTFVPPDPERGVLSLGVLKHALKNETRLLAITHASNVHGAVQPLRECGLFAKQHGIAFLVDAAQTAGVFDIDVQADNIDLLAFPGHKSLLGPMGTGGLYVGPNVELESAREGGTGFASEEEEQPDELPYRLESGTHNAPGIAGLAAGVKYVQERGLEEIRNHEGRLIAQLVGELRRIPGARVYAAPEDAEQASVVSFNLEGWEPGEMAATLDQAFDIQTRSGLHCAPSVHKVLCTFPRGTVRLSAGCFNTDKDIEHTLNAIKQVASTVTVR